MPDFDFNFQDGTSTSISHCSGQSTPPLQHEKGERHSLLLSGQTTLQGSFGATGGSRALVSKLPILVAGDAVLDFA